MDAKIYKSFFIEKNIKFLVTISLLLFLLIIFDIVAIKFKLVFPPFRNRTMYILFISIWLFIVSAVDVKQDFLIHSMNNLLSSTRGWSNKVSSVNNLKQLSTLSWSYYDNKYDKIVKYSFIIVAVYVLITFVFLSTKDLTLKTWTATVASFWICFISYLKSSYLQKYFEGIVDAHTTSSPNREDITSLKLYSAGFYKKNVAAWIISGVIVLCGFILYLFKFVDIFNVVTAFWLAFFYPALRLTVDLNIQLNRFSSTLDKTSSDLTKSTNQ